jgi:hypothetical protein
MKRWVSFIFLSWLGLSSAWAAGPEVTFDADGVKVAGVPSGSRVAWLAVVREPVDRHVAVRVKFGVEVATPMGQIAVRAKGADTSRSVWLITDIETGSATHSVAPGYFRSERAMEVEARPGESAIAVVSPQAKVLYVRPRKGVWMSSAYDAGLNDANGTADGRIVIDLATLVGVQGNPHPPAVVEAGDVILVLDPLAMRTAELKVAP